MSNHILVTAAMGFEERPIAEGLARAGNRSFEVLRTGIGAAAGEALRARLANHSTRARARPKPTLVISSGLAGIELPSIPLGRWVLGTQVHQGDAKATIATVYLPLEEWLKKVGLTYARTGYRSATEVVQVDHGENVIRGAVDMESYALAQVCREFNIPFAILRIISDTPDAPLPKAIGAFVRVATEASLTGKFQGAFSGLRETLADPKGMGRFIRQSPKLSKTRKRESPPFGLDLRQNRDF